MSAQHTPGPWAHVRKYGDNSGPINGPDGKAVATIVGNSTRPAAEKLANACLIAAAPDMLAALKRLVGVLEKQLASPHAAERKSPLAEARAAIAKATGAARC